MKKYPLLPILLLAAALRAYKLDMFYWVDELVTRERASGSLWEACTRSTYPVADVLAWVTTRLSDTEWALRLPSAAAGVAGVGAMYWLGNKAAGRRAGLFAALLLAISPFHIEHSQDARYYAFIMLITTMSLGVLLNLAAGLTFRRLAAFAGLTALGLLTHPFYAFAGAGIVAAYAAHAVAAGPATWPARLKRLAAVGAAAAAGFLPLVLFTAPRLLGAVATATGEPEETAQASRPLYHLTLGTYGEYIREITGGGILALAVLALMVVGLAVLLLKKRAPAQPLAFAAIVFFALPLPLLLIDVKHWYDGRYFSYLLPAAVLTAGIGIDWVVTAVGGRRPRVQAGLAAAAAYALLLGSAAPLSHYYRGHCPRDEWGRAAQYISGRMNEGDVVFHAATYSMQPGNNQYRSRVLEYYLTALQPPGATRYWTSCSGADAQSLLDTLQKYPDKTVWIAAHHAKITPDMTKLIARLCGDPLIHGTPALYVLGEPTENLAVCGGFEEPLRLAALPEGAVLAPSPIPCGGANCLAIRNDEPDKQANVAIQLAAPLEDGETYTLSVELKLDDVRPGGNPSRVCKIVLAGKRPDGQSFWNELLRLRGTEDWRRYVMRITPGSELPAGAREVTVRAGLFGGTGRVWVDNVQIEGKAYATPFVQGERTREHK